MAGQFGPCTSWPVRWLCDVTSESPTVTGEAVAFATNTLWALSGRRFGTCDVTLRPCRADCTDQLPWWDPFPGGLSYPQPALIGGQWFNLTCGGCTGGCSCATLSEVVLPAPVNAVTQVKVDGVVLPTTAYRLDDDRRLVRLGGTWPTCQRFDRADTEVGTWTVTASYGEDVPDGASWAIGQLACEYIRAVNGDDCRLPKQVQTLARQGVTIQLTDTVELFKTHQTGLYLVDSFVMTWNPNHLSRRSKTYNVDAPGPRRAGT